MYFQLQNTYFCPRWREQLTFGSNDILAYVASDDFKFQLQNWLHFYTSAAI